MTAMPVDLTQHAYLVMIPLILGYLVHLPCAVSLLLVISIIEQQLLFNALLLATHVNLSLYVSPAIMDTLYSIKYALLSVLNDILVIHKLSSANLVLMTV